MNAGVLQQVLATCLALASAETLHGIARAMFLVPRLGKRRATQLSIVSGSLLAFGVCYYFVPGIGLRTTSGYLLLGVVLAAFMAVFDIVMGRFLLHRPWRRALQDLNPATGNLLIVGLALLVVFPLLVAKLRAAF